MKLKVGVCECPAEMLADSVEWQTLCCQVAREASGLFLLNEMPFGAWIAGQSRFDAVAWAESCRAHQEGTRRLMELGANAVAGTHPVTLEGSRVNEGFVWTKDVGLSAVHTKQYFPDEEGFYEARWFERGPHEFRTANVGGVQAGFLICTEVMFNEHARAYGRSGADLILVPRAVGRESLSRWLAAMRMAAIVSGCYVLSSNRAGVSARGQIFGGAGWIIDPFGDLVAQTSAENTIVFHEIDTALARQAQSQYPCYVEE